MNTSRFDKPVIGIVGGIGSGKSTVASELARLGCGIVDADVIGHVILATNEEVRAFVRERWGEKVFLPDGNIDRKAVSRIVFTDRVELAELNKVLHPRIRQVMERKIADFIADSSIPVVVIDAAVLFEAGWNDLCSRLVFVDAPAEARYARVASTRGWDRAMWEDRENSQISLDKKAEYCDYIIDSSSSLPSLYERVRELFRRVTSPAENA